MTSRLLRLAGGLALLVALNAAGSWLARTAHLPLPGSVLGMLALTALIEARVLPLHVVDRAAQLLVRHLALLYVPAAVAIVAYTSTLLQDVVTVVCASLASLVAVLVVVGVLVQRVEPSS